MKKSRFTESQIVSILKEADAGLKISDICRKPRESDSSEKSISSKTYSIFSSTSCLGFSRPCLTIVRRTSTSSTSASKAERNRSTSIAPRSSKHITMLFAGTAGSRACSVQMCICRHERLDSFRSISSAIKADANPFYNNRTIRSAIPVILVNSGSKSKTRGISIE